MNVTPAGDKLVAYRVALTAGQAGFNQELYTDSVILQSGRMLASTVSQSEFSPFNIEDTERYVALAADRMSPP